MDEVLVLAWLREWRRMKRIFRPDAETTSEHIEGARSLPQGDPAAPMLFNIILDTLAAGFEKMARRNQVGQAVTGRHVGRPDSLRRQLLVGGDQPQDAEQHDGGVA